MQDIARPNASDSLCARYFNNPTKFSNPSTTFDRVALYPPIRDKEGHGPGRASGRPTAPLEPSGRHALTQAPDQPASLTGCL